MRLTNGTFLSGDRYDNCNKMQANACFRESSFYIGVNYGLIRPCAGVHHVSSCAKA